MSERGERLHEPIMHLRERRTEDINDMTFLYSCGHNNPQNVNNFN